MHKWVAIVQGPEPYLKGGVLIERFEITQEEINDCKEEGESDDEVIEYIIEEYHNAWEQRWCSAQLFTIGQYRIIDPNFIW